MSSNKPVPKLSVIVSHPSRVLVSYQCALALQEADLLLHYETGFYFKKLGFFGKLLMKMLPEKYALILAGQLNKRVFAGLTEVKSRPIVDMGVALASKVIRSPALLQWALKARNEYFDWQVSRSVRRLRPTAVVAYDSSARTTFKVAKKLGVICILDQVIGDVRSGNLLLEKNKRLHPEFAPSSINYQKEWAMQRCLDETNLADLILVPSDYVKETLIENGVAESKITIVPYGADLPKVTLMTPKKDSSKIRFIFVGHICQRKGVQYLLEAFSRFSNANVELVLVGDIVGGGEGLKKYRDLFTHISSVPYSQLAELYDSADVFVLPSLHEGSALVVFEALAAGLPVITTFNTGSVVRDNEEGFIVPICDVDTLFEKMELLSKDSQLRDEMSLKARERAKLFTWKTYRLKVAQVVKGYLS
jgi:starch synthase